MRRRCRARSTGGTLPPAPTPDPAPAPSAERYYSDASFFNKAIPANPTIHPGSAQMVAKINGWGVPPNLLPGNAGHPVWQDYGSPVYRAKTTDPLFEIRQNHLGYTGTNWGISVRIPQNALPANGTDTHMTVISPDGLTELSIYQLSSSPNLVDGWRPASPISKTNPLPAGGGPVYAGGIGKYATNGSGLPSPYGGGGDKATAAGQGLLSGDIEIRHLPAPGREGRIPHALRMAVKSVGKTFDADGIVAPALGDAGFFDPVNAPPNGARLQLNMTLEEIAAVRVGNASKTVLRCLRELGMYVFDTTGSPWNIGIRSTQAEIQATGVDPWRTYAQDVGVWDGMYFDSSQNIYVWGDFRNATLASGASIWTRLRVLDWNDPANR